MDVELEVDELELIVIHTTHRPLRGLCFFYTTLRACVFSTHLINDGQDRN